MSYMQQSRKSPIESHARLLQEVDGDLGYGAMLGVYFIVELLHDPVSEFIGQFLERGL